MKITDVKSYLIEMEWDDRPGKGEIRSLINREFVFVQIDTDEGLPVGEKLPIIQAVLAIVRFKNMSWN